MLAARQEETVRFDASSNASQQNMRERLAPECSSHALTSVNKPVSTSGTTARASSPSMNGLKQEKVKGSSSNFRDDVRIADGVLTKKVKRKPEVEVEGPHIRPEKVASVQGEERPRAPKQSAGLPPKSNFQPTSIPGLEQSS